MLSGVPGLLTFAMVSNELLETIFELPTLVHVIAGSGFPDALHLSVKPSPSITIAVSFEISTNGATKR